MKDSSPGYDNLPASILKQCVSEYITPLTYLINSSFSQGIFPDDLKIAMVLPIFKAGNEQLISNYRPISVIPFFSKVMEKIIANIIIDFLDKSNIFYDQQFGFRKNHSTNHAVILLIEKVAKALESNLCWCLFFFFLILLALSYYYSYYTVYLVLKLKL